MVGMMAGLILGALWGGTLAWRRGGAGLDMAQYAGAFGILFAIIGLIASIVIVRLA